MSWYIRRYRNDTVEPAIAGASEGFWIFPFAEIVILLDLHFSYEGAADQCSILGIIAAASRGLRA
jgi:hypothetical protein